LEMKQLFLNIINKLKSRKMKGKVGKRVKLVKSTPKGKVSSNNAHIGSDSWFTINSDNGDGTWQLASSVGAVSGWVYDYEIAGVTTIIDLEADANELRCQLDAINSKIYWMQENNVSEFDEEEFKVFETLRLLEDSDKTIIEKSKAIAALIRGDRSC
jgi:hypothetical protein